MFFTNENSFLWIMVHDFHYVQVDSFYAHFQEFLS